MNIDLDDTVNKLTDCLRVAAASVPDDPPTWRHDPGRAVRRRWLGRAAIVAAAGATAAAIVSLATGGSGGPQPMRVSLIDATQRTLATHTAQIRVVSIPAGHRATTAYGVVDFDTPAAEFTYSSGFSVIEVGGRSWSKAARGTWVQSPPSTYRGDLGRALQPDTTTEQILTALRSDTATFTDLGSDKIKGTAIHHYQATLGSGWQAEVWVVQNMLARVTVQSPAGTTEVDYSTFGVPTDIKPPDSVPAP